MSKQTIVLKTRSYHPCVMLALMASLLCILPGCRTKSQTGSASTEGISERGRGTGGDSAQVERKKIPEPSGAVRIAGVSLDMLQKAKLHYLWSVNLSMGRANEIRQLFYHDGQLFILTDDNVLSVYNGAKGTPRWSVVLGPPKNSCSPAQFYKDRLLFMVGRRFVEVRQKDGQILRNMDIKYSATTSVARSDDKLFVGSSDRRFYALRLRDGVPLWQNFCNGLPIGNIILTNDMVYFVTRDNMLYVSLTEERNLVWKYQADGSVPGVVVDNNQCLLPSADTNLYCFHPQSGDILWRYMAGGPLEELPVLTKKAIYQPVAHKSLICLERQPGDPMGKLRWELPDGYCLLAENGPVSYCMTLRKELTAMSNVTGKALVSFYVPNMDLCARNNEDALIFLASKSGSIVALAPH